MTWPGLQSQRSPHEEGRLRLNQYPNTLISASAGLVLSRAGYVALIWPTMGSHRKGKLSHRKNEQTPYHRKRALCRAQKKFKMVSDQELLSLSSGEPQDMCGSSGFKGFDVSPLKQGLSVLSLFDGFSSVLHALDMMDIYIEEYFSSEIDANAMKLQKHRFGERVTMLGSVTDLHGDKLDSLGTINLCIGGSPCNDLALVNCRRRRFKVPQSTANLFFEYVRIKEFLEAKAKACGEPFFWLYENTSHMQNEDRNSISKKLGCNPVIRDASHYLPVKRRRYFWGNLPKMEEPQASLAQVQSLNDILPPYRSASVAVVPTITTSTNSQKSGKYKVFPVLEDGEESPLYIIEVEKLFGLPESFTDGPNLSLTDRRRLLGKAFCIPVIQELLQPLKDIFWVRTTACSNLLQFYGRIRGPTRKWSWVC